MFTEKERSFVLPRKIGDCFLALTLSSVLTGFFALISSVLQHKPATGWLASLLHGLAVETMFTFCIFSFLALIWALFTPRWLEALLSQSFRRC